MTHILFVNGAWLSSDSWAALAAQARQQGFTTSAPGWPHLAGEPADLRAAPPPALGRIGIAELREHYRQELAALPVEADDVVLVGHSTGGLVAHQLLEDGHARAAVLLAPLPPKGVLPRPSEVVSTAPILAAPWDARRASPLTRRAFRRRFTYGLGREEADRLYEAQVVPAPHRVVWQVATAPLHSTTRVADRSGRPVLMISGDEDRMVATSSVRAAARRAEKLGGSAQFTVVPEAGHHLLASRARDQVIAQVLSFAGR